MVEGDLGRHLVVMVVAAGHDALIVDASRLAGEYEVDMIRCEDVYATVVELAVSRGRRALVIGRLREMAKENRHLFRIAARHGARCCALLDPEAPIERTVVLTAMRAGVAVVETTDEVRAVLAAWLAGGEGRPFRPTVCHDEEYRATEAELNALLGQETDE
jgi:hypothetical protein